MTNEITRTKKNLRPLLWLVLAISAAGNVITSSGNADILLHLGLGSLVLASASALAVDHYRNRQ
jgi:hypothetical protein